MSRDAMPEATKQIVALLRERHHLNPSEDDDFNVRRPEDVVQAYLVPPAGENVCHFPRGSNRATGPEGRSVACGVDVG